MSLRWPHLDLTTFASFLQATHLEDALGQDISSSPLWSASLLDSQEGSKAIVQTHLHFLVAGADVISTSSYQASALAFRLAGKSAEKAEQLLVKSVRLAQQAREDFSLLGSQGKDRKPLLLLSLGPYGAALSNGSECENKRSKRWK
jgi:homocysteine S-methyltransferase